VTVLDASALLAFLLGEPGAPKVERLLRDGAVCSAVDWSEVAQKVRSAQRNWDLSSALLRSYGLIVEPVTERDAEWAARRWTPGEGLSLADRLCLALGDRLDTNIWTADRSWGRSGRIRQIR
jgi:PIN domain nuclease of toxin-antitoxin system